MATQASRRHGDSRDPSLAWEGPTQGHSAYKSHRRAQEGHSPWPASTPRGHLSARRAEWELSRAYPQGPRPRTVQSGNRPRAQCPSHVVSKAIASQPERKKLPVRPRPRLTEEARDFLDGVPSPTDVLRASSATRPAGSGSGCTTDCTARPPSRQSRPTPRAQTGARGGIRVFVPRRDPARSPGRGRLLRAVLELPLGAPESAFISVRSEFSAAPLHIGYPAQTQAALFGRDRARARVRGCVFPIMRLDSLARRWPG